jgi:hypothetical protein
MIPVETRSIDYVMEFVRHVGNDNDSFVDDNSLVVTASAVPEPSSFVLGCTRRYCLWMPSQKVSGGGGDDRLIWPARSRGSRGHFSERKQLHAKESGPAAHRGIAGRESS